MSVEMRYIFYMRVSVFDCVYECTVCVMHEQTTSAQWAHSTCKMTTTTTIHYTKMTHTQIKLLLTSPNTARSPLMALACASDTSRLLTGRPADTHCRHIASTFASCSAVTGPLFEKSNRSLEVTAAWDSSAACKRTSAAD